ncbi:MAG: MBL fold metallo-hydrolase [Parcubacteria group bacterium]|nr:MBL fold metallo-hydrolase [Parcubacteria group bacterium]
MRITILNDNTPGKCEGTHGLSLLLEDNDKKILFDVGPTDIFLKNAQKLDISLDDVDAIVLSHGHWDHGDGLEFLSGKELVCHPECFIKRYRKKDDSYLGLAMSQEEAENKFALELTDKPLKISDSITFLGEIPRENDFEAKKSDWYKSDRTDDFIIDDSALAIKTDQGLVVIASCSHAGICNIVEYAKKITGQNKIHAVIGGFHLKKVNDISRQTIEYFKEVKVDTIYPLHCTSPETVAEFEAAGLDVKTVGSGDSFAV